MVGMTISGILCKFRRSTNVLHMEKHVTIVRDKITSRVCADHGNVHGNGVEQREEERDLNSTLFV